WTFFIKNNGTEYGKITKKWSGLLKESFTEADNFGVVFPEEWDVKVKALFLGAVFLIDFVHFEKDV
ncbi:MAG: phospholipid scramblase-related protein, partial [Opitutales bacterium]